MNKTTKDKILKDCKIMMRKIGDIPFDKALPHMQNDLREIGNRYNISGSEVFIIMMENYEKLR